MDVVVGIIVDVVGAISVVGIIVDVVDEIVAVG